MGCYDRSENLRIYNDYFRNVEKYFRYFINKYQLDQKKVLEIGPAYGAYLIHLGVGSAGMEIDPYMLKFARAIGLEMIEMHAESYDWRIESKTYDVVMSLDSPMHMASPYKLLLESRYVLKDDGILLWQFPLKGPIFGFDHGDEHFTFYNLRTTRSSMRAAGFKIIEEFGYVRSKPLILNRIANILLKRWGPNLWIVAKKDKLRFNKNKSYRPDWIRPEVWNQE